MNDHRKLQEIIERDSNDRMRAVCRAALDEINRRITAFEKKYSLAEAVEDARVFEYRRLALLEDAINEVLLTIAPDLAGVVKETVERAYLNGYYWSEFMVAMTVPFEANFVGVNKYLLRASADQMVASLTLSERMTSARLTQLFSARDVVAKAQLLGYGEAKTARDIIKEHVLGGVESTYSKAACIARTESCRNATVAMNQANSDIMTENDLDIRNVWLSGHDERTRLSHKELDGKVADVWIARYGQYCFSHDGKQSPGPGRWGSAKMDINCRCSMTQKVLGYEEYECRSIETYYEWLGRVKSEKEYSQAVAAVKRSEAA